MNMKNKIRDGEPYIFNHAMMEMYQKAFKLTKEYNQTDADDKRLREEILGRLLKKQGDNLQIMPGFHCQFGSNITIGDHVFINFNCTILDNAEVFIGSYTLFGPNVSLYTVNHSLSPEEREKGVCINHSIHIGEHVWLGGNVVVMPGVTVGDNSVIGAGSVVTKPIPSGVIAAGNPCRVIRSIVVDEQ